MINKNKLNESPKFSSISNKHAFLLCVKTILNESAYLVTGLILCIFLGMPAYFKSMNIYYNYKEYRGINSLYKNFNTTTGTIVATYTDKSILINGINPVIVEFQYLDDKTIKNKTTITTQRNAALSLQNGDNVVVIYNNNAAVLQHIKHYVTPIDQIVIDASIVFLFLLVPAIFGLGIMLYKFNFIKNIIWLHSHGRISKGDVTYFKHIRENTYEVEYLFLPVESGVRMRHRCRGHNYEEIGEKAIGENIDILYSAKHPTLTCVRE